MTAVILDGRGTAAAIKADLKDRVAVLAAAGRVPGLGTVLVGDDPGSRAYVNGCLLYTSPSPRDRTRSRMPSSA